VYTFVKIILGDKMLYFRNELDKNKYSTYQLNKSIENKELFKVDNGLYSDVEFVNPLEIIIKKYPNAVFTLDSAYYYYDLTDVIPDYFYLATKRSDSRINDKNIKQVFIPNDLFEFGKTKIEVENVKINIYDEERMLVELIRKKNLIPFDYYKEIINNYRKKTDKLDIYKIQEYISYYKNESLLYDTLMREVF
jgi:predicted transcriptional regulator of viral defense system